MTPLTEQFLDRLASAAVQEGLADAVYTTLSTPLGPLLVVQGRRGVLRIAFDDPQPPGSTASAVCVSAMPCGAPGRGSALSFRRSPARGVIR
jgi:hypothetical protein